MQREPWALVAWHRWRRHRDSYEQVQRFLEAQGWTVSLAQIADALNEHLAEDFSRAANPPAHKGEGSEAR